MATETIQTNEDIAKILRGLGLEVNAGNPGHAGYAEIDFLGPWLEVVCFTKDSDQLSLLRAQREEMLKEWEAIVDDDKADPYMIEEMLSMNHREILALQRPAFEIFANLVIEFNEKHPVESDMRLIVDLSVGGARLQSAGATWHEDFCNKKGEERLESYQMLFRMFRRFLRVR